MEPVLEAFFVRGEVGGPLYGVWRARFSMFVVRGEVVMDGCGFHFHKPGPKRRPCLAAQSHGATPSIPGARRRPAPPPSDIGWAGTILFVT